MADSLPQSLHGAPAAPLESDWATFLAERRANQKYRFAIAPIVGLTSWGFIHTIWPLLWIVLATAATFVDSKMLSRMAARFARGDAPDAGPARVWIMANASVWSLPSLLLWPIQPNGDAVATVLLCTTLVNAVVTMRTAPRLVLASTIPTPLIMALAIVLDWHYGRSSAGNLVGSLLVMALMTVFARMIYRVLRKVDTERAQALALTAEAHRAAAAADRAKADFLELIRHELRTPATALSLAGRQFQRATLPHDLRAQLGAVADASEVLSTVVEDLLETAKSGGLGVSHPRPTDMRVLMRHAIEAWRSSAHERWLELFLDIDADVPERILIDPIRLKQVVYALLSAALDCARQGGVRVRVAAAAIGQHTGRLRVIVAVTDQAVADSASAALAQRDSLLVATRRLADTLGGEIVTSDEPGRGAVTALLFETADADADASSAAA